jgi:hypothetical protein
MKELHDGPAGGHFTGNTTTHKILRVDYYCHTLFKDSHRYARNCKTCQISMGRENREAVPLQPMVVSRPFEQWGLDIIGDITPSSSKQHIYILTSTDYFTKWAKYVPLTHVKEKVVIQFIQQHLITSFSMPSILVFNNVIYFYSTLLKYFDLYKGIIIRYSANYYPQGNRVAKSTNKNLVRILKKNVVDKQRNWHNSLHNSLSDDRLTPK